MPSCSSSKVLLYYCDIHACGAQSSSGDTQPWLTTGLAFNDACISLLVLIFIQHRSMYTCHSLQCNILLCFRKTRCMRTRTHWLPNMVMQAQQQRMHFKNAWGPDVTDRKHLKGPCDTFSTTVRSTAVYVGSNAEMSAKRIMLIGMLKLELLILKVQNTSRQPKKTFHFAFSLPLTYVVESNSNASPIERHQKSCLMVAVTRSLATTF